MAKRVQEAIAVSLCRGGTAPAAFTRGGVRYRVESVEAVWKEMGPWWDGARERFTYRVLARSRRSRDRPAPAGVYELCYDQGTGRWTLAEVVD